MDIEPLDALAALATVGGLLYEVARDVFRFVKGRKARRRMAREGVSEVPPKNR